LLWAKADPTKSTSKRMGINTLFIYTLLFQYTHPLLSLIHYKRKKKGKKLKNLGKKEKRRGKREKV